MTELFLHHVWQYRVFDYTCMKTTDGQTIEVQSFGTYNTNEGPDFLHAKIRIGDTLWVGDVEIHVHASDWNKHKHFQQKEYNSVILHVVAYYDKDVCSQKQSVIPTFVLPITPHMLRSYELISACGIAKACSAIFATINTLQSQMWFDRLVIERFETKADKVLCDYEQCNASWEITCYKTIARALGNPLNSQPFEMLADSLDLKIISKHAHSIFELEALLFGQAGFLNSKQNCEYTSQLQNEYDFLRKKYTLTSLSEHIWKFSKMRPFGFPTIRIAQLCQLIHSSRSLTSHILECDSLERLVRLFSFDLHNFWDTHYTLRDTSPPIQKHIGIHTVYTIIINAIIPFLFAYGSRMCMQEYKERALFFLEHIPSEHNTIIQEWDGLGIQSRSAYRSQALIQLHNEYCKQKRCLQCVFGHVYFTHILKKSETMCKIL